MAASAVPVGARETEHDSEFDAGEGVSVVGRRDLEVARSRKLDEMRAAKNSRTCNLYSPGYRQGFA